MGKLKPCSSRSLSSARGMHDSSTSILHVCFMSTGNTLAQCSKFAARDVGPEYLEYNSTEPGKH